MPSMRVFFKQKIIPGRFNVRQKEMLKLGTVGVSSILNRLALGRGPNDGPAKPLGQGYMRFKLRKGLKPFRDLRATGFGIISRARKRKARRKFQGHMLDNFRVRTVSETRATANVSGFAARVKARANQNIEPWMVLSPKNKAAVIRAAQLIVNQAKDTILKFLRVA